MTSSTNSRQTSGSPAVPRRARSASGAHLHERLRARRAPERGAVQQHTLVAVGELEQLADLLGGRPTRSRSVITARWAGGSLSTASRRCSRSSAASSRSRGRGRAAAARCASVRPCERPRLDRRAPLGLERRERDAAGVPHRARACAVDEDAEDPGPQRRATLEAVNPLTTAATSPGRPRRRRAGANERPGDPPQRRVVALDEARRRPRRRPADAREGRPRPPPHRLNLPLGRRTDTAGAPPENGRYRAAASSGVNVATIS